MIAQREKPAHWAEAFGLSAAFHVGVAYLALTTFIDLDRVFDTSDQSAPALQITSLSVDTGRLTSPEIGAGADTQTTPETLAPVAETATTLDPVTNADSTTPSTAERIEPVATAQPVPTPEIISPLRPTTPTSAPVAVTQDVTEPEQPARSARALETAPDPINPVASDLPPAELAEAPTPTEAAPPTSDTEPDPLAEDLINRIRAAVGEACLVALPHQTAEGSVSLQILSDNEASAGRFADEILDGMTPRPAQETVLIDPRQCAALDYIRQGVTYPTSPMTVALDAGQIPSGTELTGRIGATGGRNVTLLLVDDNGVVQDLGGYLNVAVNTARFAAPLRRVGNVRDTRQLLIALGTSGLPPSVTSQNGQTAEIFFDSLQGDIAGNAAITLVPFEVR